VVYRLIDPEQYRGQHVMVVGGGDSALEAAGSIAEEEGTTVTLSYRAEAFSRARAKNRDRVDAAAANGRLEIILNSTVERIDADEVILTTKEGPRAIRNEAVIVCAGGVLPTKFLKDIGIEIETKFGTA
jgi:thioredoxin reductase